jgi:hypothetical protein
MKKFTTDTEDTEKLFCVKSNERGFSRRFYELGVGFFVEGIARRSAPSNDMLGICHCERNEAISQTMIFLRWIPVCTGMTGSCGFHTSESLPRTMDLKVFLT